MAAQIVPSVSSIVVFIDSEKTHDLVEDSVEDSKIVAPRRCNGQIRGRLRRQK